MANNPGMNKRRNYFIDKEFQTGFIVKFCLLVCASGILITAALYLLGMGSTTVAIINSRVVVRSTSEFLLPMLLQTVLVVMVLAAIATVLVTVFVSHKIAGPLYNFRKMLGNLKKGDFSRDAHIRSHDQLQDLAEDLNAMIASVRSQADRLKACVSRMQAKKGPGQEQDLEELENIAKFFKT